VGGCVRDALAKKESIADIDIATPEPPDQVIERLQAAGIRAIPTGLAHGTVTAMIGAQKFEITTLRRDIETDGRRAKVRFTDDWDADAARRDFTINAMSCTRNGDIYDPFGGLEDLGHGRVCFVGIARERIAEDTLRLLRFFRFYATYGRPSADIEALLACREMAPKLAQLSGERIRDEFFRILLAPQAAEIVGLMRGEQVIEHLLPEVRADDLGRLRLMAWLETNAMRVTSVAADPIRRLAALMITDADGGNRIADRLKLSNHQRDRLLTIISAPFRITADDDAAVGRQRIYEFGGQTVRDLALMAWADELAIAPRQSGQRIEAWLSHLRLTESWEKPRLPVGGADAENLGVAQGSRIGDLLAAVESWWRADDFQPDRAACLAKLKELAGE
jgi:poly(A) polymerase